MNSPILRPLVLSPYQRPIRWLLAVSGLCVVMVLFRILKSDSFKYIFLTWNLFLAWIPLAIALYLHERQQQNRLRWPVALLGWTGWLLFFPNSPYIITDLLHLTKPTRIPIWYDSLLVFSFALVGLQTGLLSLHLIHKLLSRQLGTLRAYAVVGFSLLLSGFGVYLGRFQRWNSWDVLTNPVGLLRDCVQQLTNPTALQLAGAFALIMAFLYLTFVSFIQSQPHDAVPERRR